MRYAECTRCHTLGPIFARDEHPRHWQVDRATGHLHCPGCVRAIAEHAYQHRPVQHNVTWSKT